MATAELVLDRDALYAVIDAQRRHLGLSQAEAARVLGVSDVAYTKWRHGGGFNADVVFRAARWVDRDPREFVTEKGDAPQEPGLRAA
jgi:transcriptional regulator with XRE-family HTH domain